MAAWGRSTPAGIPAFLGDGLVARSDAAAHLSLSSPRLLMRILGPVVAPIGLVHDVLRVRDHGLP
jgi:hypothetical protein